MRQLGWLTAVAFVWLGGEHAPAQVPGAQGTTQTVEPDKPEGLLPPPDPSGYGPTPGARLEVREGEVGFDEPFANMPLSYQRTGRLVGDLEGNRHAFAPRMVVAPAGSPVFYVPFTEVVTVNGRVIDRHLRGMWCGVLAAPSPALENHSSFCVEEGAVGHPLLGNQPAMTYSDERGSPYFPRSPQIVGRRRSRVDVVEEAIDFPIRQSFRVMNWSPDQIHLRVTLGDGDHNSFLTELASPVGPDGAARFSFHGTHLELRLVSEGRIAVRRGAGPVEVEN